MRQTSKTLYKLLSAYVSGVATSKLFVLQYRCHKHDERDVEGEAITAFCPVNRENLIGVRCYWREYEAEQTLSASFSILKMENVQQGREVIDEEREYSEHVEALWTSSHSQVQSYCDLSRECGGRNNIFKVLPSLPWSKICARNVQLGLTQTCVSEKWVSPEQKSVVDLPLPAVPCKRGG